MTRQSPLDVRFERRVPENDNQERLVCAHCEFVHYINPKVVVGAVVSSGERYLLCRRAIEPRRGFWTLPAGYLEVNETTEEGARREVLEEACATIEIDALLGIYNIARISQVQIFYRAKLRGEGFAAGPESEEVGLFAWEDIPWDKLAFSSVLWALQSARAVRERESFPPFLAEV